MFQILKMIRVFAFQLLLISNLSVSQDFSVFDNRTREVKSINPNDTTFNDLMFLIPVLENKRIVLLGEQEHGDGASFSAKIRFVKFLQKELGFTVLAFETPFYSTLLGWDKLEGKALKTDEISSLLVYKHWVNSVEMEPLFRLTQQGRIKITGFDISYIRKSESLEYAKKIDSLVTANLRMNNDTFKKVLDNLLHGDWNFVPNQEDQKIFITQIKELIKAMDSNFDEQSNFWRQELKNLLARSEGQWQPEARTKKNWWSSQNVRDKQMADNINWLINHKIKNQKVIVWAANYHIARNVGADVTRVKYFQNENAFSMGDYLFETRRNEMYAIGAISYSGERAVMEENFEVFKMKPRSSKSFETYLHNKGFEYAFTDFSRCGLEGKFSMAGFAHFELNGAWPRVFDGVFFINTMTPMTLKKTKN